jgi:hypothetical protein
MPRWIAAAALVLLLVVTVAPVMADPENARRLESACESRIKALDSRIESATRWGNLITVVGVSVAAIGSAVAGFAKRSSVRKTTAVIGAVSAIASALPGLLPSRQDLEMARKTSEEHRLNGKKVLEQLSTLRDENYKRSCERYAIARFTECASSEPSKTVPDLPVPIGHSADAIKIIDDSIIASRWTLELSGEGARGKGSLPTDEDVERAEQRCIAAEVSANDSLPKNEDAERGVIRAAASKPTSPSKDAQPSSVAEPRN